MPGKRELAASAFCALGLARGVGALRSALLEDLRVLAYHRVLPALDEQRFAFDIELVSALQTEFEWQMGYVARHFQPVSCEQVAQALLQGRPLPRRALMVTFDDGFRDNYEVAFPVLRRLGVPALFFLSTGYIGGSELYWFDALVHRLLRSEAAEICVEALDLRIQLGPTSAQRRAAAAQLLKRLKLVDDARRRLVLAQVEKSAGVEISASDAEPSLPMNWDQVREMAAAGMEFGSHTVSHPILAQLPDAAQLHAELQASKACIEREAGRSVSALAYPVGGASAINAEVLAATAQAGYRIAFTYQSGVNRLATARSAPLQLKRLHVERYTGRAMFEAALQWPELFGAT